MRTSKSTLWTALAAAAALVLTAWVLGGMPKILTPSSSPQPGWWDEALPSLLAPRTIRALAEDQQLRRSYLAMVDLSASVTKTLGARYDLLQLEKSAELLEKYRKSLFLEEAGDHALQRRRLNKRLFGFGSGKTDRSNNINSTATATSIVQKDLLGGLSSALSSALSGIGTAISGDLAAPAMFLGVGVGQGVAQGLNITTASTAKKVADKILTDNNIKSTGLNPAIQGLGMGLSAALSGTVNISSLFASGTSDIDLQDIVLSTAEGIGNGTSSGLQLSETAKNLKPPTGSDIPTLVGTLGFGLSKTIASNVNVSSLVSTGGVSTSSLLPNLGAVALSLGQGLGNGTVAGLHLSTADVDPTSNSSDVVSAVGNFAYGLSKSVVSSLNTTSISSGLLSSTSNTTGELLAYLPSVASGLGKGLGEGISVGLGLQTEPTVTTTINKNGSVDVGSVVSGIAEKFAMGLSGSLLANGTAKKLLSSPGLSLGGNTSSLHVGKIVQGLALGLVQGAGEAVEAMGGVEALLNGTSIVPTSLPDVFPNFNDTVDGAATGFGLGLGGQGVLVAQQLLLNRNRSGSQTANTAISANSSVAKTTATVLARHRTISMAVREPAHNDYVPALNHRRQATAMSTLDELGINVTSLINADSISIISQKVVNALTSEGVGGLFAIFAGLRQSGTIPRSTTTNSTSNITGILSKVIPIGTITVTNQGNTYSIDGQDIANGETTSALTINGNTILKLAIFLVIHILFAVLVYLIALPTAIGLESVRNLLIRLRMSYVMPNILRWSTIFWVFVFPPTLVITVTFGALAMGNASHFRTAHGILGLVTAILSVIASALHYMVKKDNPEDGMIISKPFRLLDLRTIRTFINQILLLLAVATVMTGFTDITSLLLGATQIVSFETAVTVGFGLSSSFTMGSAISGMDIYLSIKDAKKKKDRTTKAESA